MNPAGDVSLNGVREPAAALDSRMTVQAVFHAKENITFAGTFSFVQTSPESCGIPFARQAEITAAAPVVLDPTPTIFGGVWQGSFVVQSCTKVGWLDCYPEQAGRPYSFYLSLSHTATTVTGGLILNHAPEAYPPGSYDVPVPGTIDSDGGLVLQGTGQSRSNVNLTTRLLRWSPRRDALGRMIGSFSYTTEYVRRDGSRYSTTYENVLQNVTLTPGS